MGFFGDINTFFKWRKYKKQVDSTKSQESTTLQNSFEELDKIEGDSLTRKRGKHEPEKNYTKEEWLEKVRLREELHLKEAQEKQKQEETDAINELKRSTFQIDNLKLAKLVEYRLKGKNEIERRTKLASFNSKMEMADEVAESGLYRIYKLHEWLKKTDATKLSAENIGLLNQKSASSGKNFYFDSFKFVSTGLYDQNAMLECFVCDHDGVKSADRMACIPLDVYSFCKCIEHSSFSLVEKMAKSINETGYCPTRYASLFGWGNREKTLIENALVTRILEIRSGLDGLNYGDDDERF